MFSIFADSLTILLTILFPVFASYKALEASDPAQITPWLIYWVVFSLATCAESIISFFYLDWLPFYAWARLGVHLYLLLPGESQGAGYIYHHYVKPFLLEHERSIEGFISDGHAQLKTAGLDYLHQGVEYVRYNLLGQQRPAPPAPSAQQTYANYAQSLLARFTLPSESSTAAARPQSTHPNANTDIYALLSTAMSIAASPSSSPSASSSSRDAANQRVIPETISDPSDRASYISATRERLRALLSAVDKAEAEVGADTTSAATATADDDEDIDGLAYGSSEQHRPSSQHHHRRYGSGGRGFRKVESETDFESINHEDLSASGMGRVAAGAGAAAAGAGNWGSWVWGRKEASAAAVEKESYSGSGGGGGGTGDGFSSAGGDRRSASGHHPRSSTSTVATGVEARRVTSASAGSERERHRSSHDRHDRHERHSHHRRRDS